MRRNSYYEEHVRNIKGVRHYEMFMGDIARHISHYMITTCPQSVNGLIERLLDDIWTLEALLEKAEEKYAALQGMAQGTPGPIPREEKRPQDGDG